jgi:hypothetical protein
VERTLFFRLDSGDNRISLETLLDRWAGAAAYKHDHLDDRTPPPEKFRYYCCQQTTNLYDSYFFEKKNKQLNMWASPARQRRKMLPGKCKASFSGCRNWKIKWSVSAFLTRATEAYNAITEGKMMTTSFTETQSSKA